jgi:hypothetical protein
VRKIPDEQLQKRPRGRPKANPWCPHPPGEDCRPCARACTRRWRARLPKRERKAKNVPKRPRSDAANARAYVATYRQRWGLPRLPCANCGNPRAGVVHPDPTCPREYLWLCRACRHIDAERIAELVESGHLRALAKPPPPKPKTSQPSTLTAGRDPSLLPPLPPIAPGLLAAARAQVALAATLGATPDVALLAEFLLALLGPEALADLQRAGETVDLALWRPYGIDDLDWSLVNFFFRRRRQARSRDLATNRSLE